MWSLLDMKKTIFAAAVIVMCCTLQAQSGRDAFMMRQAYDEMKRALQQIDVLEANFNNLSDRIARIEKGGGEMNALKAEIEALKAEIRRLKAEMAAQRESIVRDLSQKLNAIGNARAAQTAQPPKADAAGCKEYEVEPGDTLSLIARAFGTSVSKIKSLNGLKSDRLSVGQKIIVPAPKK